jgi:hypothetical protein
MQEAIRWLRRRDSRYARIPAGVLIILGGFLSILPVFGLSMPPPGLALLAEDLPPLRRARGRALHWLERRRPHWFAEAAARSGSRRPAQNRATRRLNTLREAPAAIDFTPFLTHFLESAGLRP